MAMRYEIRVKGHLPQEWSAWFEGLTITLEQDGNTLLSGSVLDQSALHGILKKIRDLGMPLLSIHSVADDDHATSVKTDSVTGDS